MNKQIYFNDMEVGMEVPALVKNPTSRQLVKWAGASGDFNEIHYDKDYAISTGLPGIIIHGRLKASFLGQLMTNLAGAEGYLKKFSCSYKSMDAPGSPLTCKGKVARKYEKDGQGLIDCDIWIENAKGEKTTEGKATVMLPYRK